MPFVGREAAQPQRTREVRRRSSASVPPRWSPDTSPYRLSAGVRGEMNGKAPPGMTELGTLPLQPAGLAGRVVFADRRVGQRRQPVAH